MSIAETDAEDIAAFVGENAGYYFRQWLIMSVKGRMISWNWAAFLFPWAWFAYRKLYFWSVVFIALTFLAQLQFPEKYTLFWVVLAILSGCMANFLYLVKAQRTLNVLPYFSETEINRKVRLLSKGGTSWGAVIIVGIIFVFLFAYLLPRYQLTQPSNGFGV